MKRQPTEQEKIFANDMTSKGLTSKIHKQLIQLNIKKKPKKNPPDLKMGRKSEKTFFPRRHMDGQQAHEKIWNTTNHQSNAH